MIKKAAKHKRVKKRTPKPRPDYDQSTWAIFMRDPDIRDPTSAAGKLFRRRFRVPYPLYQRLYQMCLEIGFEEKKDAAGRPGVPLQLKLLGVLRVLGRATCFDGISELTLADEETHRVFFHEFCQKFARKFYSEYVYPPTSMEEMKKVSSVYERLGFPGCIGSVDCVHIPWDRAPAGLFNVCKGKEGYPTLAWECTVDHHLKVRAVTQSHYGSHNDKTIV